MGIRPIDEKYPYSQMFGANPAGHQPAGHTGEDIAAPIGTPIVAIADGTVVWADWGTKLPGDESHAGYVSRFYLSKSYCGICVIIEHDDCWTLFSHLNETQLNNWDKVKQGQLIGRVGNTGFSTGPHLHWEVIPKNPNWNNGFYGRVNPAPYRTGKYFLGAKPTPTPTSTPKPITTQSVVTPTPIKKTAKDINPEGWKVWSYKNTDVSNKDAYAILLGVNNKLDEILKRLDK